jgi:hypothetical protein
MNVTSMGCLHSVSLSRNTYLFSAAPGDDDSETEDIDGELANTGHIANWSNGKTGTNTAAEPDKAKPESAHVRNDNA